MGKNKPFVHAMGPNAAAVHLGREYSLPEAANFLTLSQTTIRRYAKAGTINSHKSAGGYFRFWQRDLDDFIQEHSMGHS